MTTRRALLSGLLSAPLVVRDYSILMPVRRVWGPLMYLHLTLPESGHYVKHWSSSESLPMLLRHFPGAKIAELEYLW